MAFEIGDVVENCEGSVRGVVTGFDWLVDGEVDREILLVRDSDGRLFEVGEDELVKASESEDPRALWVDELIADAQWDKY